MRYTSFPFENNLTFFRKGIDSEVYSSYLLYIAIANRGETLVIEEKQFSLEERDQCVLEILENLAKKTGFRVDLSLWDGRLDQLANGLLYLYVGEEDKEQALAVGFAAIDIARAVKQTTI